jgi:D-serine deaminase-like pyridoxal phosphate-dependent protein
MASYDIDTPALLMDVERLRNNISAMASVARKYGLDLRPHAKTHKAPEIAKLQIEAGAKGITVAKLGEAEVMAEAGIRDILIANQIIGHRKLDRLMALAEKIHVMVAVDSHVGAQMLNEAAQQKNVHIDVLIEIDTGVHRCGLGDRGDILGLAKDVAALGHIKLRGIMTHEGHVEHGTSRASIECKSLEAGQEMVSHAEALREAGHDIEVISVGSTASAAFIPAVEGITEMRPGTYVFNDVIEVCLGVAKWDQCALSVLATVISMPRPGTFVVDAGSKALFPEEVCKCFDFAYSGYGYIKGLPEARIVMLNEEHGVIDTHGSAQTVEIGDRIEIVPNHVCPTVNLYDEMYVLQDGQVLDVWQIKARGKVQ